MKRNLLIIISAVMAPAAAGAGSEPDVLIGVGEAKNLHGKPNVVFVFAGSPERFATGHIPGSVNAFAHDLTYLDDVQRCGGLPMCADAAARFIGALGIDGGSEVIAYEDGTGVNESGVWFFLKLYGLHKVRIMEGGLPDWQAKGFPVETGKARATAAKSFVAKVDAGMIATRADVEKAVAGNGTLILDARHTIDEYVGKELKDAMKNAKEHVTVARGGHIPTAVFSPWTKYAGNKGGEAGKPLFRPEEELRKQLKKLEKNGYSQDTTLITYCHVGLGRGSFQYLGLKRAGHAKVKLYVGSWSEWGASSLPLATTN